MILFLKYRRANDSISSQNDVANRNGDDSDEIPMEHRLVRRVNYGTYFRAWLAVKKDAYREVSLHYHVQFRSLPRNASHYVNYVRDYFVVTLLASLNDIFRLAMLHVHSQRNAAPKGIGTESGFERVHWFSILMDSFSIRGISWRRKTTSA